MLPHLAPYFVYGKFGLVLITMYHVFRWLAKLKIKKRVIAPVLQSTYDQKPEAFFWGGGGLREGVGLREGGSLREGGMDFRNIVSSFSLCTKTKRC